MRTVAVLAAIGMSFLSATSGCASSKTSAKHSAITKENNPTTKCGRGEPSLDDARRPAAWVLIDGKEGQFKEQDGRQLVQWFIDTPVSVSPTFRVEAYPPLLGEKVDFQCVFKTRDDPEGKAATYAFRAEPGTFVVGKEYSLLNPGDNFVVRLALTDTILPKIDPLPPGEYMLLGSVKNRDTGDDATAVTYFTVGK